MKSDFNIFKECIKHYFEKKEFFNPWFRKYGKSYLFVFKKNLKVTNIQYAEFISLIKSNIKIKNHSGNCSIQFLSVSDFVDTASRLFSTFNYPQKDEKENVKLLDTIEECYSSLINHIIVIDAFYGSCAIFLPYNIELNIENVCGLSGYIHSCGDNIFTRRISKAEKGLFFSNLTNYLETNYHNKKKKIPFSLYSHEDFTPFDRDEGKDFFVNGLDDIKFYAEKLYMQATPLTEVISEMETNDYFNKRLDIAKAGDYHRNIKGNNENSIWLIVDRAVTEHSTYPSKDIFFICYDQKFINENPYHLFDENKPGWIDHTTIPHTLMGAMLNISIPIARRNKNKNEKISILDPFLGSGTTYLELLKFSNISFSGSDLSKLALIVAEDNLHFFSLSYSELIEVYLSLLFCELIANEENTNNEKEIKFINSKIDETISDISKIKVNNKPLAAVTKGHKLKTEAKSIYNTAFSFFIELLEKSEESDIAEINYNTLTKKVKTFNERLLFYLFLKAYKRNLKGFERGSKNWTSALTKEIADLRLQVKNLTKLRKRALPDTDDKSTLIKYLGNYSYGCSINPNIFTDYKNSNRTKSAIKALRDVIAELEFMIKSRKTVDIIITDPPYGFNTEEITTAFAELYYRMIGLMIKCLNPNGQLLLCLPEISNTGRQIHYFTQKEIVIHQILIAASENKKTLVLPVNILPRPTWLYKAPHYWESEKALRRAILHFVVK